MTRATQRTAISAFHGMRDTQLLRTARMASLNQSLNVTYMLWQHVIRRGLLRRHKTLELRNLPILQRAAQDILNGHGVPHDPVRAARWREEAEYVLQEFTWQRGLAAGRNGR